MERIIPETNALSDTSVVYFPITIKVVGTHIDTEIRFEYPSSWTEAGLNHVRALITSKVWDLTDLHKLIGTGLWTSD